jgi:hypothetical protein
MKNTLVRSSAKLTVNYMDYFKKIIGFLLSLLFVTSSVMAQSLKDSLFGGKLTADTGKTFVSTDTGKYVPTKIYNPSANVQGETKKDEIVKLDESMPDSLNKNFYVRQKVWKRFIDINTLTLTQEASDTRKVKKGQYVIDIEYQIGLNGKVTTKSITCNPPNEYLTEQAAEFMKRTPYMVAPVYRDGKPRPLDATQTITVIKK